MGSQIRGLNERRNPKTTAVRPQRAREPAKDVSKLKKESKDTFYSPTMPEDRHFVIDSGASMHMSSKKDLMENWD